MKNKLHIKLIITIGAMLSLNCQCPPTDTRIDGFEKAFQRVPDVFIGKVVNIDSNELVYTVEVLETFKGNLKPKELIVGRNHWNCEPNIDRNGEWLFFGENKHHEFSTEICGHTFFIQEPRVFPPPPPPPPGEQNDGQIKLAMQEWNKEKKERAIEIVTYFREK